jgi:hypothetical protein
MVAINNIGKIKELFDDNAKPVIIEQPANNSPFLDNLFEVCISLSGTNISAKTTNGNVNK